MSVLHHQITAPNESVKTEFSTIACVLIRLHDHCGICCYNSRVCSSEGVNSYYQDIAQGRNESPDTDKKMSNTGSGFW